jgi:xylan 1,4-beta-xylosidase
LRNIENGNWALYPGVEFGGNADYPKAPDSFAVVASSETSGGTVEVWLDSIDTGDKIAECNISSTGDWETFEVFTSAVDSVSGRHDVYLKFTGGEDELFRLQWLKFLTEGDSLSYIEESNSSDIPKNYVLEQNHPNPFSRSTIIRFGVPDKSFVYIKAYNLIGQEVAVIAEKEFSAGIHSVKFDASNLSSGLYFYKIEAKDSNFSETKKMILIK